MEDKTIQIQVLGSGCPSRKKQFDKWHGIDASIDWQLKIDESIPIALPPIKEVRA